jgi:hypothetical protein
VAGVPEAALGTLPATLRAELLEAFNKIVKNFRERRWEPAELNGGKLCEVVYSILKGHVDGSYPARATKPRNMVAACQSLEAAGTSVPRSIRIQIPRMIVALYEIRNNRNVGHVGGDVDPNHMDAVCVLQMAKWIMAELVRVLHNLTTEEATVVVEALVERELPLIWDVDGKRRVLAPRMSMRDKTLLLLHASDTPLAERQLVEWVEHSNASVYRRDVLKKLHREKLIEFNPVTRLAQISPLGVSDVEDRLLPAISTPAAA